MRTKMKLTRRFFSILFIASLLLACSKDGEDGQDGATGPQGPVGQDGINGADGQDGEPGTANVIYSDWFPTEFGNNIATFREHFSIDFPEGSSGIIDTGTLLMYGRVTPTVPVNAVPILFQLPVTRIGAQQHYWYNTTNANTEITICVQTLDGSNVGPGDWLEDYRYIVIPGGMASSGKSALLEYSKMSYEEIAELFNIPD